MHTKCLKKRYQYQSKENHVFGWFHRYIHDWNYKEKWEVKNKFFTTHRILIKF